MSPPPPNKTLGRVKIQMALSSLCHLRQVGSLKKPYFQTEWVGVAGSDIIGCTKGGATAIVKFIFISNSCRAQ